MIPPFVPRPHRDITITHCESKKENKQTVLNIAYVYQNHVDHLFFLDFPLEQYMTLSCTDNVWHKSACDAQYLNKKQRFDVGEGARSPICYVILTFFSYLLQHCKSKSLSITTCGKLIAEKKCIRMLDKSNSSVSQLFLEMYPNGTTGRQRTDHRLQFHS